MAKFRLWLINKFFNGSAHLETRKHFYFNWFFSDLASTSPFFEILNDPNKTNDKLYVCDKKKEIKKCQRSTFIWTGERSNTKKSWTKTCLKHSEDGKRVLPYITDFSASFVHFSFSYQEIKSLNPSNSHFQACKKFH